MAKTTAHTTIVAIGIDLAKNVFQVQGVDSSGAIAVERAVSFELR